MYVIRKKASLNVRAQVKRTQEIDSTLEIDQVDFYIGKESLRTIWNLTLFP